MSHNHREHSNALLDTVYCHRKQLGEGEDHGSEGENRSRGEGKCVKRRGKGCRRLRQRHVNTNASCASFMSEAEATAVAVRRRSRVTMPKLRKKTWGFQSTRAMLTWKLLGHGQCVFRRAAGELKAFRHAAIDVALPAQAITPHHGDMCTTNNSFAGSSSRACVVFVYVADWLLGNLLS